MLLVFARTKKYRNRDCILMFYGVLRQTNCFGRGFLKVPSQLLSKKHFLFGSGYIQMTCLL